jgi:hypothetical protein
MTLPLHKNWYYFVFFLFCCFSFFFQVSFSSRLFNVEIKNSPAPFERAKCFIISNRIYIRNLLPDAILVQPLLKLCIPSTQRTDVSSIRIEPHQAEPFHPVRDDTFDALCNLSTVDNGRSLRIGNFGFPPPWARHRYNQV